MAFHNLAAAADYFGLAGTVPLPYLDEALRASVALLCPPPGWSQPFDFFLAAGAAPAAPAPPVQDTAADIARARRQEKKAARRARIAEEWAKVDKQRVASLPPPPRRMTSASWDGRAIVIQCRDVAAPFLLQPPFKLIWAGDFPATLSSADATVSISRVSPLADLWSILATLRAPSPSSGAVERAFIATSEIVLALADAAQAPGDTTESIPISTATTEST